MALSKICDDSEVQGLYSSFLLKYVCVQYRIMAL